MPRKECFRCGRVGHAPSQCYFRDQKCRVCEGIGHIAKVCRKAGSQKRHSQGAHHTRSRQRNGRHRSTKYVTEEDERTNSDESPEEESLPERETLDGMFAVKTVRETEDVIKVNMEVNGTTMPMELDTGASVTIISEGTFRKMLPKLQLQPSTVRLKTYTGERMQVVGEADVQVEYCQQHMELPLVVVEGSGPSLLGRNWLQKITLDWKSIKQVQTSPSTVTSLDKLLDKNKDLFKEGLGTMRGIEARLSIKEDAVPKFCRARAAPYALRQSIEEDLKRLGRIDAIEKISYSDWATPVVPVPKSDGSVRLCGDFKVTVNPVLNVDQHPIPKPEDLLTVLAGGQRFSKLDLSHAYQQMLLHSDDRKYTTINTHLGLYQYKRLPFGIASAPAIFQQAMEKILQGIPKAVCYLDDVLVTGRDDQEHMETLAEVLKQLNERGLQLKKSKCEFLKPRVEYLGHIVDATGLHTAPNKVKAVVDAPQPQDQKQLRSFLGLVNYYGNF